MNLVQILICTIIYIYKMHWDWQNIVLVVLIVRCVLASIALIVLPLFFDPIPNPKELLEVPGASLDVSNYMGKQAPRENVSSASECATMAAKIGAPVAVYIPAMKVCTAFNTAEGLKLGPANPNMVVLSSVTLPNA